MIPSVDILSISNDAFQRFVSDPLGLASIQSFLLVVLGMSFFGLASWKWFQRDDAYPDYGRRAREISKVLKDYFNSYDIAKKELDEAPADVKSKLEDIRSLLEHQKSAWKATCARGQKIVENYPINMAQYQRDLDYLLSAYRTANRNARTDPVPPHFENKISINEEILKTPSFNPPPATTLDRVAKRVFEAILRLQTANREATKKFPTLDTLASENLVPTDGSETI